VLRFPDEVNSLVCGERSSANGVRLGVHPNAADVDIVAVDVYNLVRIEGCARSSEVIIRLAAADAAVSADGEAPAGFLLKRPSPLSLVTTTPLMPTTRPRILFRSRQNSKVRPGDLSQSSIKVRVPIAKSNPLAVDRALGDAAVVRVNFCSVRCVTLR
jgi:hypothetical protein